MPFFRKGKKKKDKINESDSEANETSVKDFEKTGEKKTSVRHEQTSKENVSRGPKKEFRNFELNPETHTSSQTQHYLGQDFFATQPIHAQSTQEKTPTEDGSRGPNKEIRNFELLYRRSERPQIQDSLSQGRFSTPPVHERTFLGTTPRLSRHVEDDSGRGLPKIDFVNKRPGSVQTANSRHRYSSPPARTYPEYLEATLDHVQSRRREIPQAMKLIVAAIDLGTANSGWALSFRHEFEKDPKQVYVKNWKSGGNLVTEKTPTCILIGNDKKSLVAFGYDAENKYKELIAQNRHADYYYCTKFKMALNRKLEEAFDRSIEIEDSMGRPLPAMRVFSLAIDFLVKDVLTSAGERITGSIEPEDFHWVLTVPAIWTDSAKQFMREAALQAGLSEDNLSIALEPEVASLYCRGLPVENFSHGTDQSVFQFQVGTKYMIVDAGGLLSGPVELEVKAVDDIVNDIIVGDNNAGGTVDVTIHKIGNSNALIEIHAASGGEWGGTFVNDAFENFLKGIVGDAVYKEFIQNETEDWLDLCREFEMKKQIFRQEGNSEIKMRIPASLGIHLKASAELQNCSSGRVLLRGDKLKIEPSIMEGFFHPSIPSIIKHINSLLKSKNARDISSIFMVGGYSDSPILKKAMKSSFPHVNFITPADAVSVILKGAVMFGHDPDAIKGRVLKYTYGICATVPFEKGVHPESNKIINDRGEWCDNAFKVYAERNKEVNRDQTPIVFHLSPQDASQTFGHISIYATQFTPPKVIDDSLTKIGELEIDLGDHDGDINRTIAYSMHFDQTMIKAVAKDQKSGRYIGAELNFLG